MRRWRERSGPRTRPDALVTEADPEEGDAGANGPDDIAADPRFGRGARPRREDDPLGPQVPDLLDADAVVSMDDHLGAQFRRYWTRLYVKES